MSRAARNVLAFGVPAEKRQAAHFWTLLDQQWAEVGEQIATDHAALVSHHNGADRARRVLRRIARKRREQFELEQLLQQLERRFFGRAATWASNKPPGRYFEVSVERHGSWWAVAIPELGEQVSARRCEDVDTLARAHISAVLNAPMSEIAVAILTEH